MQLQIGMYVFSSFISTLEALEIQLPSILMVSVTLRSQVLVYAITALFAMRYSVAVPIALLLLPVALLCVLYPRLHFFELSSMRRAGAQRHMRANEALIARVLPQATANALFDVAEQHYHDCGRRLLTIQ